MLNNNQMPFMPQGQNNPMQLLQMLSNSQNPMAIMQQMFGNDPRFKQVLQIAGNKTPQELEQYTKNLCKTQGINIENIFNMLNIKP